jgi:hypothetical protein
MWSNSDCANWNENSPNAIPLISEKITKNIFKKTITKSGKRGE